MPDEANSTALTQSNIDQDLLASRAQRSDHATAKLIYQAQILRRGIGRRAAYTFMIARLVPAELAIRVLSLPDCEIRR